MILKNALVYRNETKHFEKLNIQIIDGKISALGTDIEDLDCVDLKGQAVVPGLVDVHTHGCSGYDFGSVPQEKISLLAKAYASHGVTTVMPTLASAPLSEMISAANRINKFSPDTGEADMCGVHLEGRYLCAQYKGAHAPEYLSALSADELDNDTYRMCKALHISAAYEMDTDGSFAAKVKELGGTLSLGHTAATYIQAKETEQRGVTAYTHLFNAMSPLHHRDGGAVCAALTGKCFAEIICDGIHIAPQMIKLAYSMLGCNRTVLITDSMEATGCPDGEYSIAGMPATVKNGLALTPTGAIAGSTLTLDDAVRNLMKYCDIPLSEAILCATENPAKEIGVFDSIGSVDVGKKADILVIENIHTFNIKKIMINGIFI